MAFATWVDNVLSFLWGSWGTLSVVALWLIVRELGRIRDTLRAATRSVSPTPDEGRDRLR